MAVQVPAHATTALVLLVALSSTISQTAARAHSDTGYPAQPTQELTTTAEYDLGIVRDAKPAPNKPARTGWLYNENLAALYPTMFQSSSRVDDRNGGVEASVTISDRITDGVPTLYPAAEGRQAAICLVQKAGSSRWKMIMHKAQTGHFPLHIHDSNAPWLEGISAHQMSEGIQSPDTLRIMFVRDPYARLLSGFLDKACNPPFGPWRDKINKKYDGPYEATPEDFARFVWHLMDRRARGEEINPHFLPMMEHCGLPNGMRYDLYLKVEEMDEWYPDVATFLGLTEAAKSGFDTRADPHAKEDDDILDCFYPLKGSTCRETSAYLDRYQEDRSTPRPGNSDAPAAWQQVRITGHAHGADAKIASYYTEEVAELAYQMLQMDLEAFGYPKLEFP